MNNKNLRGLLGLAAVALLAFGVIWGTRAVTGKDSLENGSAGGGTAAGKELDVDGAQGIEKAVRLKDGGYETVVRTKGYGGDITMAVNFRKDKKTVESVAVLEQTETEDLGALIAEEDFLGQFAGMKAPVAMAGASRDTQTQLEGAVFADGVYEALGQTDDKGFADKVSVTVKDGKISEVSWDAVSEDGKSKAQLSQTGEYTMTEDGLTWKEQAEALAAALVESQSLSSFSVDDQGKTDAVAGVSISIGGFLELAQECLRDAAGIEADSPSATPTVRDQETGKEEQDNTGTASGTREVDGISGATVSSTAVARGINQAYEFLQGAEE